MPKTLEERVDDLENFYRDIPDLVNTRFNRVNRELADLKSDVAEIKDRVSSLETKVDALPAIMAEVIRDELKK